MSAPGDGEGAVAPIRVGEPCLVVLVGPAGAGKSTWARRWFAPPAVVSADELRGIVGTHERDQRASTDAFEVLELIAAKRLRRGLTTVLDSTGLDAKRRARWRRLATDAGVPCVAVAFDVPDREVRARNRRRGDGDGAVPSSIVTTQLRAYAALRQGAVLEGEGFAAVHPAGPVELVPARFADALAARVRQEEDPVPLRFGLQLGRFAWEGGAGELAGRLTEAARTAEEVGFDSISLIDHLVQVPQIGREWEDLPDVTTTLGFLAAATSRVRLGALVHPVTLRHPVLVAKQVATLDVLSGGRAFCGLGLGWFEREHRVFGVDLPPVARRYELLADALELLPLLWGPGAPRFEGRTVTVEEAICYPRPLQTRIPLLVGGSGERRTLRLVAEKADACNIAGDPAVLRRKVEALRAHCDAVGREPAEVTVTALLPAAVVGPGGERGSPHAGTVDEQIGRFREVAEAGVHEVMTILPLDGTIGQIERFAPVIQAFRDAG